MIAVSGVSYCQPVLTSLVFITNYVVTPSAHRVLMANFEIASTFKKYELKVCRRGITVVGNVDEMNYHSTAGCAAKHFVFDLTAGAGI